MGRATVARRTSLPTGTVTVATFRNPVGFQLYDDGEVSLKQARFLAPPNG